MSPHQLLTASLAQLPRYPAYKPTSIPWLGQVPEHWEVRRLKYAIAVNPGVLKDSEEDVVFLAMESVSETGLADYSTIRPIDEVGKGYTAFSREDLILAKITPCFENGKMADLSDMPSKIGYGSTEFHVLRPTEALHRRFVYWLLREHAFKKIGEDFMVGTAGQKRIQTDFLKNYSIPLPPLAEQEAIAGFLDRKTAELDAARADLEALVERLQEYRTALITQAVTKGLDPTAPLRPSGIPWLGQVPEHWEVRKLKQIVKPIIGGTPSTGDDSYYDGDIDWVTIADMKERVISTSESKISSDGVEAARLKLAPRGSILYSFKLSVGKVAIAAKDIYTNEAIAAFPPSKTTISAYIAYSLECYFVHSARWNIYGARIFNQEVMGEGPILLPPLAEQEAIAGFLDRKTAAIDAALADAQQQLALLAEYRTAIITAAVTGQVDVRGAAWM